MYSQAMINASQHRRVSHALGKSFLLKRRATRNPKEYFETVSSMGESCDMLYAGEVGAPLVLYYSGCQKQSLGLFSAIGITKVAYTHCQ